MKKRLFPVILIPLMLSCHPERASAWGPQGHSAIGQAAVARISPRSRARLRDILGVDSQWELDTAIEEACFWPDTVREEPEWAWSPPLHYVNIPRDATRYDRERDCPDGLCVTEAIPRYAAELNYDDRERQWQAFAWLCHLVADLHQPLHAGFADDRGANHVEVEYRGERLNLHRFWDSALAADRLAAGDPWLPAAGPEDGDRGAALWDPALVIRWTEESHALASAAAYPPESIISDAFADRSWSVIREQWSKASDRLALILDAVLGGEVPKAGGGRLPPGVAQSSRATRKPIRASWRSGLAEIRKADRDWSGELAQ
jgi:hypothetical protein